MTHKEKKNIRKIYEKRCESAYEQGISIGIIIVGIQRYHFTENCRTNNFSAIFYATWDLNHKDEMWIM